jgi:hypothetical protein
MGIVHWGWCDKQVFQHGKLIDHSLDDLLQTRNRHTKVYASHTITVLESKHNSSFIFGGEIVTRVIMVNNQWKGRGVSEHFCHRDAS